MKKLQPCKFILSVFAILIFQSVSAQNWTWVAGSDSFKKPGNYGTKGVAAVTNIPPPRMRALNWTDATGNFWMYGGDQHIGISGYHTLGDLWMYNPSTSMWTWVSGCDTDNAVPNHGTKGLAAATNTPGARSGGVNWLDSAGNLWLLGGGVLEYNDLWKFSPSTNLWTWVGGSDTLRFWGHFGAKGVAAASNWPTQRNWGRSWINAKGTLWLFGGKAFDRNLHYGIMNDLWKYDIASGLWTWVSGADTTLGYGYGNNGVHGVKGVASPTNIPDARNSGATWMDAAGRLWMFGGADVDISSLDDVENDMWMYDPATNEWTWMNGSNNPTSYGHFGTYRVPGATNSPPARQEAGYCTDRTGAFWLFGGRGYGLTQIFNDLWKFDPVSNEWTWIAGADTAGQLGVYGVKGTASPSNTPGAGINPSCWASQSGDLWLFGGERYDVGSGPGEYGMNDLWKFGASVFEGVDDLDPAVAWALYPNPASNKITIKNDGSSIKEYTITNMLGEALFHDVVINDQQITINISSLTAGIYLINVINSDHAQTTKRFVKE